MLLILLFLGARDQILCNSLYVCIQIAIIVLVGQVGIALIVNAIVRMSQAWFFRKPYLKDFYKTFATIK